MPWSAPGDREHDAVPLQDAPPRRLALPPGALDCPHPTDNRAVGRRHDEYGSRKTDQCCVGPVGLVVIVSPRTRATCVVTTVGYGCWRVGPGGRGNRGRVWGQGRRTRLRGCVPVGVLWLPRWGGARNRTGWNGCVSSRSGCVTRWRSAGVSRMGWLNWTGRTGARSSRGWVDTAVGIVLIIVLTCCVVQWAAQAPAWPLGAGVRRWRAGGAAPGRRSPGRWSGCKRCRCGHKPANRTPRRAANSDTASRTTRQSAVSHDQPQDHRHDHGRFLPAAERRSWWPTAVLSAARAGGGERPCRPDRDCHRGIGVAPSAGTRSDTSRHLRARDEPEKIGTGRQQPARSDTVQTP